MDSSLQKQAAVDPGWFGESLHCKSSGDTRSHWCKPMGQVLHNYFQQKWKALFTLQRREKDKGSFSLNKTIMGWGIRSREAEISASRLARYERGNWLRPRLVLILWRQRIQKSTDTSVHTYPDTQRIQKFPLWKAYTEISGYTERIRRTRVDARCIRIKKLRIQKSPDTCGRGLKTSEALVIVRGKKGLLSQSHRPLHMTP